VVAARQAVGTASTEWGGSRRVVPVVTARAAWLLGIPGQLVTATLTSNASGNKTESKSAGAIRYTLGSQTENVPVRMVHHLSDPGWFWKLFHN
jgi:hypothetical protein